MGTIENSVLSLSSSSICRLCAVLNFEGKPLFNPANEPEDIVRQIHQLIPSQIIKVQTDQAFPNWICSTCHLKVETIAQFFSTIRTGQTFLGAMLKENRVIKPNEVIESSVEELKKKRGRPPRKTSAELEDYNLRQDALATERKCEEQQKQELIEAGFHRRQIRPPIRFNDTLKGDELDRLFADRRKFVSDDQEDLENYIEEVIDEDDPYPEVKKEIIGHMKGQGGTNLGDLLMINSSTSKNQVKMICEVCTRCFVNENKFLEHVQSHQNVRYECTQCQLQFRERAELAGHHQTAGHSGEGIVEGVREDTPPKLDLYSLAMACGYELSDEEQQLKKDDQQVNDLPNQDISRCTKSEDQSRMFACSKCHKMFKSKMLLQRHYTVHSDNRPFICTVCDSSFKTKQILANHQLTHNAEKNFTCTICDQKFSHKSSLNLHYRWHNNEKPFVCEVCKKSFTQNGNLREHMRIHTGERPFSCKYCSRSFKTSSQRRLHMQRHMAGVSNEKPWTCEMCEKTFLLKTTYECHMRSHTGDKRFGCGFCERRFTEHWGMVKHQRTHTGEKPYTCLICEKTFRDCSNLAKHKKIHENAKKTNDLTNKDQLFYITYQNPDVESALDGVESLIVDESDLVASVNQTADQTDDLAAAVDSISQFPDVIPSTNSFMEFSMVRPAEAIDQSVIAAPGIDGRVDLMTADGQKIQILSILQEPLNQFELGTDLLSK